MFRKLLLIVMLPLTVHAQDIQNIDVLFDSLKTHPQTIGDQLNVEKALIGRHQATGKMYPSINLFGRYDYSTSPSGLIPIVPNDLLEMVQDQKAPQPFSENILRIGASISMPVFAKSIYTMAAKAKTMYHSAEARKYINLLKNEAMIVSLNSTLQYEDALENSLTKKRQSLLKTKEIIIVKVKNNRTPGSSLLKIDNGINEIDIMKADIARKRSEVISMIQSLTGIIMDHPVKMVQTGTYQGGELMALDPLRLKIEADKLGLRAEKEKLWPALVLSGSYYNSAANAYNNDKHITENFGTIGLTLRVPILAKDQYAQISKSKMEVRNSENELKKMKQELIAQANQLQTNLQIVENEIKLYEKSLNDKEKLLRIAKVSYESDRMTIEDYLKYEDDVVMENSKLYKSKAEKWQTLMKLAVIYGNNIENLVK